MVSGSETAFCSLRGFVPPSFLSPSLAFSGRGRLQGVVLIFFHKTISEEIRQHPEESVTTGYHPDSHFLAFGYLLLLASQGFPCFRVFSSTPPRLGAQCRSNPCVFGGLPCFSPTSRERGVRIKSGEINRSVAIGYAQATSPERFIQATSSSTPAATSRHLSSGGKFCYHNSCQSRFSGVC